MKLIKLCFCLAASILLSAQTYANDTSKILATSALSSIEGSAGGGIVPWAVIGGYGSTGEWSVAASSSQVNVEDFKLSTHSLLGSYNNRLELSYAQQALQVLPLNTAIVQNIFGAKARLAGDLIYQGWPQVSAGFQYKINENPSIAIDVLGAHSDQSTDYYITASKLWLHALAERNLLLNATLRYTDANQTGLLGFGQGSESQYRWVGEVSAGLFLNHQWAIGGEFRQQPNKLASVDESHWWDLYSAWFPNKRVAVVAAYVDLGTVALWEEQRGMYLSIQITH
ncbi:DUF3034 family protein [Reinekea forsetii]|nr:DUF3034 family protein [Reinekea forsetii]